MKEDKFRCHPSIIVEKTWWIISFLFFIMITDIDNVKDMVLRSDFINMILIFFGGVAFLLFILIYNTFIWYKTFISIEENTIIVQRDTINSKINTYGIKNIANINLEQNIFERIIGTYKIKIDTDSLSTADTTDIEIVLSRKDAYEFKYNIEKLMKLEAIECIEKQRNKLNYNEDSENRQYNYLHDEEIDYDIVFSINDILKHCFYNFSIFGFIFGLGVFIFTLFIATKADESGEIISLLLIITSLWSIIKFFIGDLIKYYKFSIKRLEDKLYISYGLLKKRKFTIPINRINAINIKQPIFCRIFQRYQVDISTIGVGDDESEGSQILLCSTKENFLKYINTLLPEFRVGEELILARQDKNYYKIKIAETIIVTMLISLIMYIIYKLNFGIDTSLLVGINIAVFLLLILIAYMSYITYGFYMGKENVAISQGIFSKNISIIKYKKVQYINIKKGPISSRFNLCHGEIYILASLGNEIKTIGYYDDVLFEELKNKILSIV